MIREGMFLGDRYELLEKIGSGGMADVYKAKCHKLNRYVAIKILKDEFCKDRNFVTKFRIEAQSAACLSHNNIVGIYDVGEEGDIHYIVMELVEGITLKEYIAKKGKLEVKESIGIAIQVAQGLSAAHERHIVHRDIKPQNIIISRDGKVKVTDFGIARAISEYTINSNIMGSVHYLSPEQARGGYCDERSDIYSLGITLYEMVTGRVPFDGDTTVAVAIAHINDAMIPPSQYEPSIPPALEQIIFKCTQKKAERRYLTANELIIDLRKSISMPMGDFVTTIPETNGNPTVMISQDEMNKIRQETAHNTQIPLDEDSFSYEEEDTDDGEDNLDDLSFDEFDDEYDDEYEDSEEVSSNVFDKILLGVSVGIGIIILVLLIYIVGSLAGWFQKDNSKEDTKQETVTTGSETLSDNQVYMPSVLGKTQEEATKILNDLGLGVDFVDEWEYSDTYGSGTICKQEYPENTVLDKHTRIKLTLSLGSDKFEVNSDAYVNGEYKVFELRAKQFDLDIEKIEESNEDVKKDIILRLEPSSGFLSKGDKIKVYVSSGPAFVKVPNLTNMTETQAKNALEEVNLELGDVSKSYSNDIEAGLVMNQSLSANSDAKVKSKVNITISLGKKTVAMPDLVGKTKEEAESILSNSELKLGTVTEQENSEVESGKIISQSVLKGTEIYVGDKIDVVISSGKKEIKLPENISNYSESEAKSKLEELKLKVSIGEKEYSDTVKEGNVIRAEYKTPLKEGDTVTLIISLGKKQENVTVSNWVGQNIKDVTSIVKDLGLEVTIVNVSSDKATGTILSQSPTGGTVQKGSHITFQVSDGTGVVETTPAETKPVNTTPSQQTDHSQAPVESSSKNE